VDIRKRCNSDLISDLRAAISACKAGSVLTVVVGAKDASKVGRAALPPWGRDGEDSRNCCISDPISAALSACQSGCVFTDVTGGDSGTIGEPGGREAALWRGLDSTFIAVGAVVAGGTVMGDHGEEGMEWLSAAIRFSWSPESRTDNNKRDLLRRKYQVIPIANSAIPPSTPPTIAPVEDFAREMGDTFDVGEGNVVDIDFDVALMVGSVHRISSPLAYVEPLRQRCWIRSYRDSEVSVASKYKASLPPHLPSLPQ